MPTESIQKQQQQTVEAAQGELARLLEGPMGDVDEAKKTAQDWVTELIERVKGNTFDKTVTRTIKNLISELDAAVSRQLAAIMHDPKFQKLEGTWRGLQFLVKNSETSDTLKLRVLNVTRQELLKDVDNATELDQSEIFKKIYEGEFGSPGGEPYGALIGDFEFSNHPEDIALLSKMSSVAAAAFCPFISAASPALFGFESFTDLSKPRDLAGIFEGEKYIKWRSFRDSEDSRFVALTMPRVLARLPWGSQTKKTEETEGFNFEEVELGQDGQSKQVPHDQYCWMNAAYVLGTRLTDAFAKTGWCTALRGAENGGKVEDLPTHVFTSDDGDADLKCPTEIGITDRREAELARLGLFPLSHYKNTDYAVFFGAQTAQRPKKYDDHDATANAAISARLPYMMATSRIAHYLKMIARDRIGSFMDASDCQDWLNNWIKDYVLLVDKGTPEDKAKFPLAEAKIEVKEIPGSPGEYSAKALLRPWLQMEKLTAALSMVATIPKTP